MKTDSVAVISCDFENPVHCDALVDLMNEYITDQMGGGEPYTAEQKVLLVEGLRNHPSKLVCFAVLEGKFIGLINAYVNFATFTVKPFINIHDVIVTSLYRNKGIGRLMLLHILEKAKELNCSKVTLEVREDNKNARHLYNSLGFGDSGPVQYYWTKYL